MIEEVSRDRRIIEGRWRRHVAISLERLTLIVVWIGIVVGPILLILAILPILILVIAVGLIVVVLVDILRYSLRYSLHNACRLHSPSSRLVIQDERLIFLLH